MSKPSGTNSPITFSRGPFSHPESSNTERYLSQELYETDRAYDRVLGGYSNGVPPLPIPNREVKPINADGTAVTCGRVGSRLLRVLREIGGLFFCFHNRDAAWFRDSLQRSDATPRLCFESWPMSQPCFSLLPRFSSGRIFWGGRAAGNLRKVGCPELFRESVLRKCISSDLHPAAWSRSEILRPAVRFMLLTPE